MGKAKPGVKGKPNRGVDYSVVCKLGLALPGVEESTSYGTAALKVRGKLLARLKEDGETLVLRTTMEDRERLLAAAPDILYLTDHYVSAPWILVHLSKVDVAFLHELVTEAWRLSAPVRLDEVTKRRSASKRK